MSITSLERRVRTIHGTYRFLGLMLGSPGVTEPEQQQQHQQIVLLLLEIKTRRENILNT